MLDLQVPKTSDYDDTLFYLTTIECSKRCSQAVLIATAGCYFRADSTRDVETIVKHFGIESTSSSQVSKTTKMLDEQIEVWRNRKLGEYSFIVLYARYQGMRHSGVVRNVAVSFAIDIDWQGTLIVLGMSVAISETEIHWRSFLESLFERKLRSGVFFVFHDLACLKVTRQAIFTGAKWQCCQFRLSHNSVRHAPNEKIKMSIGDNLRQLYNTESLEQNQIALYTLVDKYSTIAPKRVVWLEMNVPVAYTVFSNPQNHGRNLKPSKLNERALNQHIKRRARKVRIFPHEASLLRRVTSI